MLEELNLPNGAVSPDSVAEGLLYLIAPLWPVFFSHSTWSIFLDLFDFC